MSEGIVAWLIILFTHVKITKGGDLLISKYDYYALLPLKDQCFHFQDDKISMLRHHKLIDNGLMQQFRLEEEHAGKDGAIMRVWFMKLCITKSGLAALHEYEAKHPDRTDTSNEENQNQSHKDPLKVLDFFSSTTFLWIILISFFAFLFILWMLGC